jgi:biopolymer transport protein ExbD
MTTREFSTTPPGGSEAVAPLGILAAWTLRQAARHAPSALRGRLEEEWLAHMAERGGSAARLRFAVGCFWAAIVIHAEHAPAPGTGAAQGPAPVLPAPAMARSPHPRRARTLFARRAPAASATMLCEINTTPLIDVMLVLVVTLLISLPIMTHAVSMDLPRGTATGEPPEVIDLEIDSDGTIAWNGTALADLPQLESYLRAEAGKVPQPEIHLRPDRRARYDVVAKVLAASQRNHMQHVGMVNTSEFRP